MKKTEENVKPVSYSTTEANSIELENIKHYYSNQLNS